MPILYPTQTPHDFPPPRLTFFFPPPHSLPPPFLSDTHHLSLIFPSVTLSSPSSSPQDSDEMSHPRDERDARDIPGPAGQLARVRHVRARIAEAVAPAEPPQYSTQQILNALNVPGFDSAFSGVAWREAERFVSEGGVDDFLDVLAVEDCENRARHQYYIRPLSPGTYIENIAGLRAAYQAGATTPLRRFAHRFSHLVAVIDAVRSCPDGESREITMKDPSDTLTGCVHSSVLNDPEFGPKIKRGSVIVLARPVIFAPRGVFILNIVRRNVVAVFEEQPAADLTAH